MVHCFEYTAAECLKCHTLNNLDRQTRILWRRLFLPALLAIWCLLQPILTSCPSTAWKLVSRTMLPVFQSTPASNVLVLILEHFSWPCAIILSSLIPAYCTGLLLARRVLKLLNMDAEYEGNVEVCYHS